MPIESQLKFLDIRKLKMSNGMTLEQNLYVEAERLKDCIQNRLDIYLNSNPPRKYNRTGGLQQSLQVDDILNIKVLPTSLEIDIFFDENAIHRSGDGVTYPSGSIWKRTNELVNTAYLLNYGYAVKKNVWFKGIENFGWRKGANFVENGIKDFNATNKLGIKITVVSYGYSV